METLDLLNNAQILIRNARERIQSKKATCPCNSKLLIADKLIESSKGNVGNYLQQKGLNSKEDTLRYMNALNKTYAAILGGSFAGQGINVFAEQLDIITKKSNSQLHEKPSVWINILGGLSAELISYYKMRDKPEAQLLTAIIGANMLAQTVNYGKQNIFNMFGLMPVAEKPKTQTAGQQSLTTTPTVPEVKNKTKSYKDMPIRM